MQYLDRMSLQLLQTDVWTPKDDVIAGQGCLEPKHKWILTRFICKGLTIYQKVEPPLD